MMFMEELSKVNLAQTLAVTMTLFTLIDIIGSIPIIVNLKKKFGFIEAEKATIVSAVLMLGFLFIGNKILKSPAVDPNAFAIAGAFVIFIIAIEMILGIDIQKTTEPKSASVVPIAFPLVAGAGTLTTIISLKSKYDDVNIILGIIINVIIVYAVLKSSNWLESKLSDGTLQVLKKFFGIILLAMSVKLFTENFAILVKMYFKL